MVCLSWILFGRPFDRNWLTMQPFILLYFKRSSVCDWLFLLTSQHALSTRWKRAKCSPRQSKNSKIFPEEHAPGSYLHCPNAHLPDKILATRLLLSLCLHKCCRIVLSAKLYIFSAFPCIFFINFWCAWFEHLIFLEFMPLFTTRWPVTEMYNICCVLILLMLNRSCTSRYYTTLPCEAGVICVNGVSPRLVFAIDRAKQNIWSQAITNTTSPGNWHRSYTPLISWPSIQRNARFCF